METGITSMSRSASGTTMPMNRMNGSLRMLATQATGTSGPVGSLLATIGMFTVGAGPVAVALIAIAAIAKGYELLTSKARAAAKEQKSLADSLGQMFKPSTGPDSDKARAFNAALQERVRIAKEMRDVEAAPVSSPGFKEKRLAELAKQYQELGKAIGRAMMAGATELDTVTVKVDKTKAAVVSLKQAVEEMAFSWRSAFEYAYALDNTIQKITLRDAQGLLAPVIPEVTGSGINTDIGLTKEQIKTRDALIGNEDKNTEHITGAIHASALIIAQSVTSAMNVGGGGRGSGIGGAVGSVLGAGLTVGAGVLTSGLWGIVGGLAGSLIGGLFDNNTKATNANTEATRANTAALMLNAPSGYKTAGARFDATEIRTAHQRYLTRGGTPILGAA